MAGSRVLASGLSGAIGCRLDPSGTRLIFVEYGGRLCSVDLVSATLTVLGSGYLEPEDLAITADGSTAFVTERVGNLLKVDLASAERSAASVVASGLMAPQQLALFEDDGVAWVVEYDTLGRLVEVDLGSGTATPLATGLDHPVGMVARADHSAALVSEQAAAGGRITQIALPSASRTVVADGLTSPFFLSWVNAGGGAALFTERDPADRVGVLDIGSSPATQQLAVLGAAFRPSSSLIAGTELIVCSDSEIVAYDISAGFPATVTMRVGAKPLYVGSYRSVRVDTAGTGVAFDDLDFSVPAGRRGGDVSPSRDATFDPARPAFMLLAGYRPDSYLVRAHHRPTGALVGEAKFVLTDRWKDDEKSPSKWFNGIISSYAPQPTWGGGSSTAPQNYNTTPALGTKRVGVLFVDTADQRYTTNATTLAGFRTRWQQNLIDGVVGGDGVSRSVRTYYREVSYQTLGLAGMPGMDVTATVFTDLVHLSGHWGDYYQMDVNGLWQNKGELATQAITAAGDGVDLTVFDMLVFVSQAVGSGATGKVAWPYGGGGINVDTSHGHVVARSISMPNEWGDGSSNDQGGGRTIYETLTHEMGHTINLPDEYKPSVPGRMLAGTPVGASWDPMEAEATLPHMTLPHRMMLGWTQATWIKRYDFQAAPGTLVDDTFTLTAIENGPPPAGKFSGVEVRVGDGRNYYAEYRRGQPGEIGDEQLVPNARVVLVDVSEPPDPPVIARPDILLVAKHSDDDGAVLDTGDRYHEIDNTTPTFPSDFVFRVVSHTGNEASVRVRYGVIGKPDPSIRPWPRDAAHQWQSPDIEVRNTRNLADSAWANVPWAGNANTVVAKVMNRGTVNAPGVVTDFFVKDYTVGGAPETFLGTDTHDVAPGATVEFSTTWNVPAPSGGAAQHFCIIVRIHPYDTPTNPPVHEMTDANNSAQSNYDRFISATSVPSRESVDVTVGNPYKRPTRFFLNAGQSNPLYRTYLEHTWLRVPEKTTQRVRAMFEFAPDAEQSDPKVKEFREKFLRVPNWVNAVGLIETPNDKRLHGPSLISGVSAEIVTGKSTRFQEVNQDGSVVVGMVVSDDGKPVPSGAVVLTGRDPKNAATGTAATKIGQGGRFLARLDFAWDLLELYYTGAPGYADCDSTLKPR